MKEKKHKRFEGEESAVNEWEHPPMQGAMETLPDKTEEPEELKTEEAGNETVIVEISESIPVLSDVPPGWFSMETAPKDRKIVVSETGEDQACVYWRPRRVVDRKNLRYQIEGKWTDDLSRLDIDFDPRYWRPYVASDYIPVPRHK